MDIHVSEFFSQSSQETPRGNFHKVLVLHEAPDLGWEATSHIVPNLPCGWFELAQLAAEDRIEFTRDYWIAKMRTYPKFCEFLLKFFAGIDDIGIYITQRHAEDPYEVHLIYSLIENKGFFRGMVPANEVDVDNLQKSFTDIMLPADYLAFLQIHNGFCKATDLTGLLCTNRMFPSFASFQAMLAEEEAVFTTKGQAVNPKSLIPFYESFGMPFYQCFWSEWYPEQEMGNVYYSGITNTIADVGAEGEAIESMAFPTFLDWFTFYLEQVI